MPLIQQTSVVIDADRINFDNTSNGFTSTNVQAAIEEARDTAIYNLDGGRANTVYGGLPALDAGGA